jgi:cytochrome c oxidase subunit I
MFMQMWARSPLPAPFVTPDHYFLSVTGHGVAMAYVLTTFFIMGFGYFTAETALERALPGKIFAWMWYILALAGAGLATVAIWAGQASHEASSPDDAVETIRPADTVLIREVAAGLMID